MYLSQPIKFLLSKIPNSFKYLLIVFVAFKCVYEKLLVIIGIIRYLIALVIRGDILAAPAQGLGISLELFVFIARLKTVVNVLNIDFIQQKKTAINYEFRFKKQSTTL